MLSLDAVSSSAFCFHAMQVDLEGEEGVSHDIQMVNKLPVSVLAMRECTSVLQYKAMLAALGIDEQVRQ